MGMRQYASKTVIATLVMGTSMVAMAGATFANSVISPPTIKIIGTATWYVVSTAGQLEYIDQNQTSYLDANIELTSNVNLSSSGSNYNWTPLGNVTTAYSGTFNGNGHTVSGWTVNTSAVFATR